MRRLTTSLVTAALLTTALVASAASTVTAADETSPSEAAAAGRRPCTLTRTLRIGMSTRGVLCLERRLRQLGLQDSYIDGDFGTITRDAVIAYERSRRLRADGVVGRRTGQSMGIWDSLPWCNRAAKRLSGRHGDGRQIVIVRTESWSSQRARVYLAVRVARRWTCSDDLAGMVGRNGTRKLRERRSGDGTTPAGVFKLARMTAYDGDRFSFFGNASDPGVPEGRWRQVRYGDCYGATPGTSRYGHLRYIPYCSSPDEYLPYYQNAYTQAAVIGANAEPGVSGDAPGEIPYASAIFLHRHSYGSEGSVRPTAGCVSLASGDLAYVLRRMRMSVRFAIGPGDYLYHRA